MLYSVVPKWVKWYPDIGVDLTMIDYDTRATPNLSENQDRHDNGARA
jgi:hypothetical protein